MVKRGPTHDLMPSTRDHISGVYTTGNFPCDILKGILWERPGIVAEMFTFRTVHNGPACHDSTIARGKSAGGRKKGGGNAHS